MNLIDGKNLVVNSLIHPKGSGYSVGDIIHASEKLSRYKFINCWKIDKLDRLNGEVVHSYAGLENVDMYRLSDGDVAVFVECEIPRGETYWYNERFNEYGSLSLRVKSIYTRLWKINCGGVITAPMDIVTLDKLKRDIRSNIYDSYSVFEFDAVTGEEKFVYESVGLNDI